MDHREQIEYLTGLAEFDRLRRDETFLDFVLLYAQCGSGHRGDGVSFTGGDPSEVALASHWIRRLSSARPSLQLRFDDGDDLVERVRFWARRLCVDHDRIRLRRRRPELEAAAGASAPIGVITVRSSDEVLRIRLRAWADRARGELVAPAGFAGTDGLSAI
jgi:hypothetical protein